MSHHASSLTSHHNVTSHHTTFIIHVTSQCHITMQGLVCQQYVQQRRSFAALLAIVCIANSCDSFEWFLQLLPPSKKLTPLEDLSSVISRLVNYHLVTSCLAKGHFSSFSKSLCEQIEKCVFCLILSWFLDNPYAFNQTYLSRCTGHKSFVSVVPLTC